eukprot:s448_g43.t1
MAPPCGTASRARLIQRRGRRVRTETHPDVLPSLTGVLLARVLSANCLYQITCDLVRLCESLGKLRSVENPGRSFLWMTTPFVELLQELNPESEASLQTLGASTDIQPRNNIQQLHPCQHAAALSALHILGWQPRVQMEAGQDQKTL